MWGSSGAASSLCTGWAPGCAARCTPRPACVWKYIIIIIIIIIIIVIIIIIIILYYVHDGFLCVLRCAPHHTLVVVIIKVVPKMATKPFIVK